MNIPLSINELFVILTIIGISLTTVGIGLIYLSPKILTKYFLKIPKKSIEKNLRITKNFFGIMALLAIFILIIATITLLQRTSDTIVFLFETNYILNKWTIETISILISLLLFGIVFIIFHRIWSISSRFTDEKTDIEQIIQNNRKLTKQVEKLVKIIKDKLE